MAHFLSAHLSSTFSANLDTYLQAGYQVFMPLYRYGCLDGYVYACLGAWARGYLCIGAPAHVHIDLLVGRMYTRCVFISAAINLIRRRISP